jgi:hypothetical protein
MQASQPQVRCVTPARVFDQIHELMSSKGLINIVAADCDTMLMQHTPFLTAQAHPHRGRWAGCTAYVHQTAVQCTWAASSVCLPRAVLLWPSTLEPSPSRWNPVLAEHAVCWVAMNMPIYSVTHSCLQYVSLQHTGDARRAHSLQLDTHEPGTQHEVYFVVRAPSETPGAQLLREPSSYISIALLWQVSLLHSATRG